ncbi:MAG TPA: hypothetical protein VGL86_03745 [Polyangia bacterium]|jgi:hypothetical protein
MRNHLGLIPATLFAFVFALGLTGCGDDTTSGATDMSIAPDMVMCSGGPVTGAMDKHCYDDGGAEFIAVDPAQCTVDGGDDSGGPDFGDTMYNSSGNDDDCKYAVSFTIPSGICDMGNTFFVVTLKDALTNTGIAGAMDVRPEVFKNDAANTPVSTATSTTTDMGGGVYKIGPVKFPSSGSYTIRYHFYENCTDTPTSPHGHAAFFLNVP